MNRPLVSGLGGGPAGTVTAPAERPQLTSLVDMMVILVVFLLHSFSADEQSMTPAPGIDLPVSSVPGNAPAGLPLVVSRDAVRLGDRVLGTADGADLEESLRAALTGLETTPTPLPLPIQVDRGVPFALLSRVLAGCTAAGRAEVQLVVQKEAS